MQEAAAASATTLPISWALLIAAERKYSVGRLRSLEDEWNPTYPDIERIFQCFAGISDGFTIDDLPENPLYDLSVAGESVTDETSLVRICYVLEEQGRSMRDVWRALIPTLYRVSFLGIKPTTESPVIYSYEDIGGLGETIPSTARFFVHPSLHRALNIGENPTLT